MSDEFGFEIAMGDGLRHIVAKDSAFGLCGKSHINARYDSRVTLCDACKEKYAKAVRQPGEEDEQGE